MTYRIRHVLLGLTVVCTSAITNAQVDSTVTEEEEDYSIYDNLDFADEGTKRFCSSKIEGLSPAKFISLGYDLQGPYTLQADRLLGADSSDVPFNASHGIRFNANVPTISRNDIIIQLGATYWEQKYEMDESSDPIHPLGKSLTENGLRTMGLNTTIFKPLNETDFILFQGSADLNGDWAWNDFMPLQYLKYSAAALYGKRPHDRKQWAVGLARTYRVGELNYIPIVLFNYTDIPNKWGTEILFPARAHVRRTFNPRNMLFFGYELEGQSYRLWQQPLRDQDLEIRRGELRFRFVYECSLKDFIWLSAQAGYRINYSFDVDRLPEGNEFFRGFFGNQQYVMQNGLGNTPYINVSINLVSP